MAKPGEAPATRSPVADFILLYAVLYGAFGAASPFLPAYVEERGIPAELIGVVFGAGTAIRLISAPIAGRIADRTHALRLVLALCAIGTALAATGYLAANSFWPLLVMSLLHAIALAPTTNLADALALVASRRPAPVGFEYGWVRGAGSAAFIVASIIAGWAIAQHGLSVVIWMQALLMLAVPLFLMRGASGRGQRRTGSDHALRDPGAAPPSRIPARGSGSGAHPGQPCSARHVLSHSLAGGRHLAADDQPALVAVGGGRGGRVLRRRPLVAQPSDTGRAIALAALAGAFRWIVAAFTADVVALALIQPLHGITFALLHLACMRLLARIVPDHLAATAQAIYGTVGVGAATALITVISGLLYARMGVWAFGVMSMLCLAALPIARSLSVYNTALARH